LQKRKLYTYRVLLTPNHNHAQCKQIRISKEILGGRIEATKKSR